ncbi:hypothetical protein AJ78_08467 [Emergomyces pasteurianus Ep9510]|uniref:Uncharacterized protein n=1 Tax=Emergomyces pasteurianus Ep9510 TaxID=1447872 RepID=A0A1J9Q3Q1_9EURO|nr:hypothetical protein AJ78_08467 [Emergomyces pasteurianus Ep9510]
MSSAIPRASSVSPLLNVCPTKPRAPTRAPPDPVLYFDASHLLPLKSVRNEQSPLHSRSIEVLHTLHNSKTTWRGCGQHVANVMDSVPSDLWCTCTPKQKIGEKEYPPRTGEGKAASSD